MTHKDQKSTEPKLHATPAAFRARRGVASLPAIILFGGLMVEIGLAGAFLIYYLNNSLYGTRLSQAALVAAQAGIEDGMLKVILDKSCPNISCPASYSIETDSGTADVVICKDSCSGAGTTQITSTGSSLTRKHKIVAVLTVNTTTGLVTKDSITEIPL
jgi:hypothetical protein